MNDEALIDNAAVQKPSYAPLGEVLSAARKAKKLSEQDVCNNLRLSLKQISDIENNDFSSLQQPMITRGFIRNYARLLELDAEPLLNSYRARMPESTPKSVSVQSSMYQVVSGKESQPWLKYILSSILILLFLLAWVFYIDYMPKPVKTAQEKAPEVAVATPATTEIALPEIALPAAERQAEAEAGATTDAAGNPIPPAVNHAIEPSETANVQTSNTTSVTTATNNSKASNDAKNVTSLPQPNTAVDSNVIKDKTPQNTQAANALPSTNSQIVNKTPAPTSAPQAVAASTAAAATQKVSLSNTEKTWIQVTDKAGKVIYERTLPANSTDGFDGQPPFNVVIGNAKATKLSYMGKPVDLASSTTQNNVARLKLE